MFFVFALTWGQAPAFGLPARPPLCEAWADGFLWLKPVFISRQSLNKFIEKLSSCSQRAFGMPPRSGGYAQKTTPSLGAGRYRVSDYEDPKGITNN